MHGIFQAGILEYKISDSIDLNLNKVCDIVKDKEAWHAAVNGVTKSQKRLRD